MFLFCLMKYYIFLAEERNTFKDTEEKLKNQISELSLRERVLMRRLAAKEQDMQEFAVSFNIVVIMI